MNQPTAIEVMESPCTSHWLKMALQQALARDPVDAVNDTEILLGILQARLDNLFKCQGCNA